MKKKRACYVITLSKVFPFYHNRKGEDTGFRENFLSGKKLHTMRMNYPLWVKRFKKIDQDEAYISLREWTGLPYRSKQSIIKDLYKSDGIGLEMYTDSDVGALITRSTKLNNFKVIPDAAIAEHDGLTLADYRDWFWFAKPWDAIAVIHFTSFRYN